MSRARRSGSRPTSSRSPRASSCGGCSEMKARDLRDRTTEDLAELERSLANERFQSKFKNFTNRLDDTSLIRKAKRDLARVKLILAERARGITVVYKSAEEGAPKKPKTRPPKPRRRPPRRVTRKTPLRRASGPKPRRSLPPRRSRKRVRPAKPRPRSRSPSPSRLQRERSSHGRATQKTRSSEPSGGGALTRRAQDAFLPAPSSRQSRFRQDGQDGRGRGGATLARHGLQEVRAPQRSLQGARREERIQGRR